MTTYRVVYERKGQIKTHSMNPTNSLKKAQDEAKRMNVEAKFFRWNRFYFVQKAEASEWTGL